MHIARDSLIPTATGKRTVLNIKFGDDWETAWQKCSVVKWSKNDALSWFLHTINDKNLKPEAVPLNSFYVDGWKLWSMTKEDFLELDAQHGAVFYDALHERFQNTVPVQTSICSIPHQSTSIVITNRTNKTTVDTLACASYVRPINFDSAGLPTAAKKCSKLNEGIDSSWRNDWSKKLLITWTTTDVIAWIFNVLQKREMFDRNCIDRIQMAKFNENGSTLRKMTEKEFLERDQVYGKVLYTALSEIKRAELMTGKPRSTTPHHQNGPGAENMTEMEGKSSKCSKNPQQPSKKRRRNKESMKYGRLWQFITDLLHNPQYCPSHICWENHEKGIFRMVQGKEIARIWGERRDNQQMTYEKFSRAMRYHYKSKIFLAVPGRKHVYAFGPKAKGWQCTNPNFTANA